MNLMGKIVAVMVVGVLNEGEENEIGYYYAETTAQGWKLGEMPDLDSNKAYVYEA